MEHYGYFFHYPWAADEPDYEIDFEVVHEGWAYHITAADLDTALEAIHAIDDRLVAAPAGYVSSCGEIWAIGKTQRPNPSARGEVVGKIWRDGEGRPWKLSLRIGGEATPPEHSTAEDARTRWRAWWDSFRVSEHSTADKAAAEARRLLEVDHAVAPYEFDEYGVPTWYAIIVPAEIEQ